MRTDQTSGEHIMKFSMGTPPIDIYAIADTGSDLLWTKCQPCFLCYKSKHALFDRRKSSTFRNITCGARECRLVAERKPANYPPNYCSEDHEKPCVYHYSYADESYSEGLLVKETITMASTTGVVVAVEDIIVGCGIKNDVGHNSATRNEMGMIGFGRGPLSFVSQIAPYVGGNRFSHCLVPASTDPIIESKIYFGNGSEVLGEGVVSTPLVDTKEFSNNYIVIAEGITVGNEFVSFNSSKETMDKKYKMVVDSGTPLSIVPRHIFDPVITLVRKMVDPKLEPIVVFEEEINLTRLCLNSTTIPEEPKVTIHFEGGGKLQLMTDQLFYNEPEYDNRVCFAMVYKDVEDVTSDNYGFFGGHFQGNLLVGFDMDKKVASFKPTNCLNF
ncbi:hypothetical protein ACLB2K_057463 [Fragaria x ananassa]